MLVTPFRATNQDHILRLFFDYSSSRHGRIVSEPYCIGACVTSKYSQRRSVASAGSLPRSSMPPMVELDLQVSPPSFSFISSLLIVTMSLSAADHNGGSGLVWSGDLAGQLLHTQLTNSAGQTMPCLSGVIY